MFTGHTRNTVDVVASVKVEDEAKIEFNAHLKWPTLHLKCLFHNIL